MTRAKVFLLKRFRADRRGVAALEFALVTPTLLALYLGGYEATEAVAAYRKVADTTVTLANVTAQYTSLSATDMEAVFAASSQVMAPLSTANLSMVVSEITTDSSGQPTVTWSQAYNGAVPLNAGAKAALPSGLANPGTSYILVTTSFLYTLPTGFAFSKPITLQDQIYMIPRNSASIPYTG
jgi:Flp pilus assembly protein TadG